MSQYILIGERLSHSLSGEIHRAFGRYAYSLRELAPAELVPFLRSGDFSGLNVTIPYKQAVIPYLDALDETAAHIGAVNTVVRRDGRLIGCNTDFGGMRAMLSRAGIRLRGKRVLILGTGGTSRTALAVAEAEGTGSVLRVSRTGKDGALTCAQAVSEHPDTEILINTTPAGMEPDVDSLPVDPAAFPRLEAVADAVYRPLRTRLVLRARDLGLTAADGLYMLVSQAALACALFTGSPVPAAELEAVYRGLVRRAENLVLIGMPDCGKTTVGRLLARRTGMDFVDLDEEIVRRSGRTIPALFAAVGERGFRALEAETVRELSRRVGCVIAAGGGTVLDPENLRRLRQSGKLILLQRPLESLRPDPGRPLADTPEKLAALFAARAPIYAACADLRIPNHNSPEAAADAIVAALGKDAATCTSC